MQGGRIALSELLKLIATGKFLFLLGMATTYTASPEAPLYCDQFFPDQTLTYGGVAEPWVALDMNLYSGWAEPGEMLVIYFEDGTLIKARALDAGRFGGRWVGDHPELPIVVDIPKWLAPQGATSWPVIVMKATQ